MRKLLSIFSLALLLCTISFGQAAVDIVLSTSDGTVTIPVSVGLDLAATDCLDPALTEGDLPPFPPAPAFEMRFDLAPYGCGSLSSYKDFRNAPAFPFTGNKQHTMWFQTSGGTPINVQYDLPTGAVMRITDQIGGVILNIGPFSGAGTAVIPGTYTAVFSKAFLVMEYTNVGPVGGPVFAINPPSLNFGNTVVGENKMLVATVSNPGTDPLTITNVVSSDPQFTFTPNVFPIVIPPAGNVPFNVTFAPTALGNQSGSLTFSHDGPGPTTNYSVSGVGVNVFSTNVSSVNFGNVGIGATADRDVNVTNNSNASIVVNALILELPYFDVTPASHSIAPGATETFVVSFSPTAAGNYSGSLELSGPGFNASIPLSGAAVATFGLVFQEDTVWRLEDDFYQDRMQLMDLDAKAQAIQFRLQVNKAVDDNVILTFQSIQKGADVSDASWVLDYNIFRGPITANGASVDEIFVLLYNLNQDGGLDPGNYSDLLRVNYRVADLPALQDSVKSSFQITNAEGSTYQGFPIDITPSNDELVVLARNRVSSLGDVNGDGCLDILDLILVVDHIVGRDSLFGDMFTRADIAPWVPGNELPDPDGFVNVQDLSLIQNIILTGVYPNGTEIGDCGPGLPKSNGSADATVTFYINNEGITAFLNTNVGIRGAQVEFNNVQNDPSGMVISTDLGQGYYNLIDQMLKTVMYDRLGSKYIDVGEHIMADMPFVISNPEDITLRNIILVDINKRKLGHIDVEIIHGTPTLPLDYVLWQNYPNPFNPSTAVQFQVPKTSDVTIKIYDMLGQEVRTLFTGEVMRGTYSVQWDGLNESGMRMSSGSYIYRMISGDFVQSKKMVLVK